METSVYLFAVEVSVCISSSAVSSLFDEHLEGTCTMNWDRVEGQWKQRRGKAVGHWGKMMNDELAAIAGKHEQLVGILQEKYGIAKEDAKRQINEFKININQLKKSNADLVKFKKSVIVKKKKLKGISVKAKTSSKRRRPS